MGWWLLTGVLAGAAIDRICVRKVLEEKNDRIEKTQANLLILEEWLALYRGGCSVADVLRDRGFLSVAIYGMGILGNHLYQELDRSSVQVKYIMDRRTVKGVYHGKICGAEEKVSGVDAIIVTPVYQFEEIKKQIQKSNDVQVISLRDLLDVEK